MYQVPTCRAHRITGTALITVQQNISNLFLNCRKATATMNITFSRINNWTSFSNEFDTKERKENFQKSFERCQYLYSVIIVFTLVKEQRWPDNTGKTDVKAFTMKTFLHKKCTGFNMFNTSISAHKLKYPRIAF